MSDINISGIPSMGFQGGGGGYFAQPGSGLNNAYQSQGQVNNYLGNLNNVTTHPGFDPFAQSGGFGSMTDYYSSLGASYGRATGGFGGTPGRVGTIGNPGTSNPGYLDSASYNPFVAGAPPIQHYGGMGGNQVFDNARYLQQNPDVWKSGATPWEHYNQYGKQEGRQAPWSDIFNSSSYMQQNPDVARAGVDPTAHWLEFGQKEGRAGQTFNPSQYLSQNQDVWKAGADPWQHWNQFGKNEGRQGAWNTFDTAGYFAQNPDVKAAGVDPMAHWFEFGNKEGRQGAQIFDNNKYLTDNPDVWAAGADPFQHYKMFGEKEGRAGSWTDAFNSSKYLQQNPDVAASGMDPTAHWYQFGSKEGRQGDWGGLSPLGSYQGTGFDAFDPNIYGGSHPTAGFGQQPSATADPQDWGDLWKERGPFNRSPQQGAANEGRDDLAARYYAGNRDVYDAARASGQDFADYAKQHIMAYGDDEGRGFFDEDRYLQQNQDVAASGMDPTAHWMQFGQKEGREAPMAQFNYADYLAKNPDVLGSGMDPMAHWLEFGANEKRQGALGANQNTLVAERNAFAEMVRTNPELANQLAVKLYQEDQGSGDSRTAIMETMLNRLNATGQNPLNPAYYPKDKDAYNSQIRNKVLNDEALLSQIYQEMERAFGGSNLSNYATDWGSADVADTARQYATPTWTSPTNEQFFRKDISNPWAGAGTAARNQRWYGQFNK